MRNGSSLESRIKKEAGKLGFFHAGISSIEPVPHFDSFNRWLADGFHGEMSYLARQATKRGDLRLVFPEARSVLVLGMNYFRNTSTVDSPLKGKISRYARGEDYHGVLRQQLDALLRFIQKEVPSADGRCYVDTGPVMEKAWGANTTLGWMGKHTNLISKHRGSWFFLAVLLLNLPLEPDPREEGHCGTCSRCMEACPTGAIVAPYVLDSRRCLSYLTIELRGVIPRHLRPLIGNRIFGCDDCQEACPWNRFSAEASEKSFHPRRDLFEPDLISFAGITHREFKRRFEKSPIYRATRDGFVRNVVTALGNSGSREAIPALEKALYDASGLVRASAVWALWRISPESTRTLLPDAKAREIDLIVLDEINFVSSRNYSIPQ